MIILNWLLMALSILITAYIVPGVTISGVWAALWLTIFLAIVNVILRPFLILITLPINILTLGLFTFVINALLVLLSGTVIKGFEVQGFWAAIFFSVLLSIISYTLSFLAGTKK